MKRLAVVALLAIGAVWLWHNHQVKPTQVCAAHVCVDRPPTVRSLR